MIPVPRAKSGLLKHPLEGQTLVYEPAADKVHLLNPVTAVVLELLEEGGWTAEGIRLEVSSRLNVAADETFLPLALETLQVAGLLAAATPPPPIDQERRAIIKKAVLTGASALLASAIVTLTPSTGYTQSGVCVGQPNPGSPPGTACDSDDDCCGPATRKCVEYGGSSQKRCCFCDRGTNQECINGPACATFGFCCSGVCDTSQNPDKCT